LVAAPNLFLTNMTDDEWGDAVMESPYKVQSKTAQEKHDATKKTNITRIQEFYHLKYDEVTPLRRIDSSILPNGYEAGSVVAIVGPPGTGKSRFALQECYLASKKGKSSCYLYNESVKSKFNVYAMRVAQSLGLSEDDISNVWFTDKSKNDLKSANYDTMENVANNTWVEQVRKWLISNPDNPILVIIDSYSNISRKFVPQMAQFHQHIVHGLSELYKEFNVEPVTIIIHQKSQSSRERNDDSVVGGFGVTHEADTIINLKCQYVDVWLARRFGLNEGDMFHSIQIPKDRYPVEDFHERAIVIRNGKLILSESVNERVTSSQKPNEYIPPQSGDSEW
jgi:KaiC/GvpD/RAD55 family RecA-like ATPase